MLLDRRQHLTLGGVVDRKRRPTLPITDIFPQ